MEDIKNNVAKNIAELRVLNNMTQMELAQKLNYSDKAISKWERGDSIPDVSVLVQIADLFGVTLDFLVRAESIDASIISRKNSEAKFNRRAVLYVTEIGVWTAAIFAFILTHLILNKMSYQWLYLVYALPVALIVRLVFNSIWFNPRQNYLIVSALMWAVLVSVHLTFLHFSINVAPIYFIGVAGQIVIVLCSFINKTKIK